MSSRSQAAYWGVAFFLSVFILVATLRYAVEWKKPEQPQLIDYDGVASCVWMRFDQGMTPEQQAHVMRFCIEVDPYSQP